jgi:carboxyl-terminal processing protease
VFVMDGGRSGLKLTTAKYYPPSGKNIHRSPRMTEKDVWGIMPDEKLRVSLTEEQTRKLYQRWRNSEVPGAGTTSSGDASTANPDADGLSDDPALQKAHEHLKEMLHPI